MALNEVQLPTKAEFYRDVQSVAGEILSRALRWNEFAEFINTMGAADLAAMGVPSELLTEFATFRTALNGIVAAIDTEQATFDTFRRPLII